MIVRLARQIKFSCLKNVRDLALFFSRLKVELIYAEDYQSINEARAGIFEYIEVFYNRISVRLCKPS
ncbi:hypothetical protein ERW49_12120 [Aliivibrio finisterrensis]|uniref:Integrase catalytic domain-containing protein n=1 Tax=Aliivibrio finisterrensis TaxID=511998 RepID=A0A4Q5KL94_9GAMM|nr:hypothetical protein ERW49_12120 [Aliivibrio finisterrensis]